MVTLPYLDDRHVLRNRHRYNCSLVAAARRSHARKNQEVAQETLTKDTGSETTLAPRSTNDSDTTRGLSEKSPKSAAPDAEKPCWSFCDPWRKFKLAKPCLER
jgi:hypothetical protein